MGKPRRGTLASQQTHDPESCLACKAMVRADFIAHCREYHPRLRFLTLAEHDADHRLNPAEDHDHRETEEPPKQAKKPRIPKVADE